MPDYVWMSYVAVIARYCENNLVMRPVGLLIPKLKFLFRNPQVIRSIKLKARKNNMLISLKRKSRCYLLLSDVTGYHPKVLHFLSVSTLITSLEYYKC